MRREEHPTYRKWLRFYLNVCSKYRHPLISREVAPDFCRSWLRKTNWRSDRRQRPDLYPNGSERDLELFNRDQSRILTWSHDETARLSIISQGGRVSRLMSIFWIFKFEPQQTFMICLNSDAHL